MKENNINSKAASLIKAAYRSFAYYLTIIQCICQPNLGSNKTVIFPISPYMYNNYNTTLLIPCSTNGGLDKTMTLKHTTDVKHRHPDKESSTEGTHDGGQWRAAIPAQRRRSANPREQIQNRLGLLQQQKKKIN